MGWVGENPVAFEGSEKNCQSRGKNQRAAQQSFRSWNLSVKDPIKERRRNQGEVKKWSQIGGISNVAVSERLGALIEHTEDTHSDNLRDHFPVAEALKCKDCLLGDEWQRSYRHTVSST